MSIHKIKYTEANAIASIIADKAFEHLIKQINARLKDAVEEITQMAIEEIGEATMERWDLKEKSSWARICVNCSNGDYHYLEATYDTPCTTLKRMELNDDKIYAETFELVKQKKQLENQKQTLRDELRQQIEGKSAKTVVIAWPEATDLIYNFFKKNTVENMTRPLDALLAKYLPALPAPE